jgi:hypothetical protein
MTDNGHSEQAITPESFEDVMVGLQQPTAVAELTLAEVRELKAYAKLAEHTGAEVKRLQEELGRAQQLNAVVGNARTDLAKKIVAAHDIDLESGQFSLDDEAGVVVQTHRKQRIPKGGTPDMAPRPMPVPAASEPGE